ncbi:hypothetical protein BGZ46_007745 [Entomortierella lignicola]|nr:hypothetical protein BGZ46_007745 [Entomortierella lignicola]
MLGPASLRSQQPTKASLRTYGSRGKRASSHSNGGNTVSSGATPKQFSWERLENERKARLELQAQARQLEREQSLFDQEAPAPVLDNDMLYPDSEPDDSIRLNNKATQSSVPAARRSRLNPSSSVEHVPSTQGSDSDQSDHPSQKRPPHHTSRISAINRQPVIRDPVMTIPSTQDSDSEMTSQPQTRLSNGGNIRSAIRQLEPPPPQGNVPIASPTRSSIVSRNASQTMDHKAMFHEEVLFEEEDDEDINGDGDNVDEVLFRTPSFHILQRLKELPKPRIPEPRVNPFGFGSLSGLESGSGSGSGSGQNPDSKSESVQSSDSKPGLEKNDEQTSLNLSTESPPKVMRNPFLESPSTKKSLDIINKRAQQLVDLQRHRKSNGHESSKFNEDTSMEIEREELALDINSNRQNRPKALGSSPSSYTLNKDHDQISQEDHIAPRRQVTSEFQDADQTGKDDSLDIALGKRMSSIEITPRRLLAKQRKMADQSSVPPTPSFLKSLETDNTEDDNRSKSLRLFLDRDIPQDEHDDLDDLIVRAQQSRRMTSSSAASSLMSLGQNTESSLPHPPTQLFSDRRSSSLAAPKRPQLPKFNRNPNAWTATYNQGSLPNPFLSSNDYDAGDRRPKSQPIPNRELTPPKLIHSSSQPSQTLLPSQNILNQPDPLKEADRLLPPERKIRSLKRPPSVLVSSRKSVFRPTVDDLLSICDQRFFAQFRKLDANFDKNNQSQAGSKADQTKDPRNILDFESLIPECMIGSLSKIGEASYSEVYTVDLPVKLQRQYQRNLNQNQDEFALFQNSRLNTYVQESSEDDLIASLNMAGQGATKLVMKVMPFFDDQDNCGTESQSVQERGRRTKGRRKAETALLALEDIYREAMVSTQIMHGWKGFIGSFGALVVRGKYPKTFLSVWDRFRKEKGTESERPDTFTKEQLYCIILLPYGGVDLEHCPLTNWRQAWSVLTQVAASLEPKEQAPYWFEHRDLHWGNILVKGTQQSQIVFPKNEKLVKTRYGDKMMTDTDTHESGDSFNNSRKILTFGIIVQMIDFTLARVQGDKGNLIYMDLEKDQDLFRGQGDYQFEIYRKMRRHIGKDWASSCPRTNFFWLHYIADKLLTEKNLKKPNQSSSDQKLTTGKRNSGKATSEDEKFELWCYERVLAVSKMNLDRLDPSGQTPSGTVLDLLLFNQP